MDFDFLDYDTIFSCTGDVDLAKRSRVCFADLFHPLYYSDKRNKCTEHIKIYIKSSKQNSAGNYCFCNLRMMHQWIKAIQDIVPFTYSITMLKRHRDARYLVDVDITCSVLQLKFVLTWIRYLYEFPYNAQAYDILHLYNSTPELKDESLLNLYYIVVTSLDGYSDDRGGSGHGFFMSGDHPRNSGCILHPIDYYKNCLSDKNMVLNLLNVPQDNLTFNIINEDDGYLNSSEKVTNRKSLNYRLKVYRENYNTCKLFMLKAKNNE